MSESAPEQTPIETLRSRHELVSTIVLAIAGILTAWSAFQASKWSGRQSIELAEAAAARTAANRAANLADQQTAVDVELFVQWLAALAPAHTPRELRERGYRPDPETLDGFLYERFREEFKPALHHWLELHPLANPDAPRTPFEMKEYAPASAKEAERQLRTGDDKSSLAHTYLRNSDQYGGTTVIFAVVLLFAGLATKFESLTHQKLMLAMSIVLLLVAGGIVLTYPIAP